jgi:hypothetical protein
MASNYHNNAASSDKPLVLVDEFVLILSSWYGNFKKNQKDYYSAFNH